MTLREAACAVLDLWGAYRVFPEQNYAQLCEAMRALEAAYIVGESVDEEGMAEPLSGGSGLGC